MDKGGRGVIRVPRVRQFENGLTPDELEAFHESLLGIYLDPLGNVTGALMRRLPPLVHYVYRDARFGLLYRIWRLPGDTADRIEVFYAAHIQDAEQDSQFHQ